MKKWVTIISLMAIIGLAVYVFTEARHVDTGDIISVYEDDIWVIQDSEKNIKGKTEKELSESYKFKGTIYDTTRIPFFIKDRLQVGQKVRVFSDGIGDVSASGGDEAALLFILK